MANNTRKILTLLSSAMLLSPSISQAAAPFYYYDSFIGVHAGGSFGNLGDNNPTIRYGTIVDEYPVSSNSSLSAQAGLKTGYEFLFPSQGYSVSMGLGFYATKGYKFKGNLVETAGGASPCSLYYYSFDINSYRLMLEGQVNWIVNNFAPFFTVGVGPAWNNATAYKEVEDRDATYPPQSPFGDKTKTSVAYQIGVGISYLFNLGKNKSPIQSERLSLQYLYVSAGDVEFDSRGSVYPYKLKTGRFSSNDFFITYIHYM